MAGERQQIWTDGVARVRSRGKAHREDCARNEADELKRSLGVRRRQVLEFFKALPPCLIGMEACATAHYWARELTKLGHEVRLMPGEGCEGLRQAQQKRCG